MKETSGEFSMTVVVIIGAILIVGFLSAIAGPMGDLINDKWHEMIKKSQNEANTNWS